SITALQAFYMNDTSELQTMADYGGQDTTAKSHKAEEMRNINEPQMGTPSITIDKAMDLIVRDAKDHPDRLVPGAQTEGFKPKASEVAQPGAPQLIVVPAPPPAPPAAAGSGSGSGSGSGAGAGSGSANAVPLHGTGSPADKTQPVPGAGGAPKGGQGSAQRLVPGGHAR
ncbi:MAG TPA: hypothetical protein VFQ65_10005, partial [Kofleriaceae bacterium]|nr:hypothetical protein [Kofleriaceae bacterium]